MTTKLSVKPGKVKAYGLVRDKDGNPKIDKIQDIPPAIWALLTEEERQAIRQRGGNLQGEQS